MQPIYSKFRSIIVQDLKQSDRLRSKGLNKVLCKIATFMFKSDYFAPPPRTAVYLEKLVAPDTSLVFRSVGPNHV